MQHLSGKSRKAVEIIRHLVLGTVFFYPWIETESGNYNALTYFLTLLHAKSLRAQFLQDFATEYAKGEISFYGTDIISSIYAFWAVVGLLSLSLVITVICLGLACFGRRIKWMEIINIILALEAMTLGPVLGLFISLKIMLAPMFYVALMLLSLFIAIVWDSRQERREIIEETRRKKKEKKQRLKFQGHYGRLYYRLMWKNSMQHKNDIRILLISSAIISSFLFAGLGLRDLFQNGYGSDLSMYGNSGLTKTIQDYLILLVVIALILLSISFHAYWQGKLRNMGVLLTLGIRRRDLFHFLCMELVVNCSVAVLFGMLLGHIYILLLRICLAKFVPGLILGHYSGLTFLLTVLIMAALLWFAYHIGRDMYNMKNAVDTRVMAAQEEVRPGKSVYFCMIAGALVTFAGIWGFHLRRNGENILYLVICLVGIFLLLYGGWGWLLQIREKSPIGRVKRMLSDYQVRFRYKTTSRYVIALTVIHITVLFYFLIRIGSASMPQSAEELFPYDYMCLADEAEEPLFEQLEKECDANVDFYPMIRVTAYENTESLLFVGEGDHSFFEGINIGVSESVYRQLKEALGQQPENDLDLDREGSRIYVVYQQDQGTRSQPLDWMKFETNPHLHIGTRLRGTIDQYPARTITGEEVTSLTGVFAQGKLENIVVFSDPFFEQMQSLKGTEEEVSGPNRLHLIKVPAENQKKADKILEEFSEKHIANDTSREYEDSRIQCVYKKQEAVAKYGYEKVLQMVVNGFLVLTLISMSLCLMYLKVSFEIPEMKQRYSFLMQFGMKQKERIYWEKKEISRFYWISGILTVFFAPCLTLVVLTLRCYSADDLMTYGKIVLPYVLCYILLQLLSCACLQRYAIRRIERVEKNRVAGRKAH